ncbi:hypothetical protein GQ473_03640 [archaeon]|nr:hypothetical protein [archaeon]
MSYIGLFELDDIKAKQNILTYGEDVPKYLVCFVCGDNLENNKTLLDANNNILTPTLTAIYSDVRDEYLVIQQLEWTLGMFNDCGIVDSTKLCGDFSKKSPVCTYLGKDVKLLGTRFDNPPDKKLKKIIDLGATYNLIHSKPLGEDTTTQLKESLKKPSHIEHIGGIPSWHKHNNYNGIGLRLDRALSE